VVGATSSEGFLVIMVASCLYILRFLIFFISWTFCDWFLSHQKSQWKSMRSSQTVLSATIKHRNYVMVGSVV